MTYQAPVEEFRFVLSALADLDGVLALPPHADLGHDTIDAVLHENARFVQDVVAPLNRSGDLQPARCDNGQVMVTAGFCEAFKAFAQGGWQGLHHDPQWGGQGLPRVLGAAAAEALHAANMAFALCPMLTDGVIEALSTAGSAVQCERYIPALLQGRWTGTMNLTEPQAGSDLAQVATRAVPQADGTYRLFGQKIFITYGDHDMAENIVHLVLARTPDAPKGVKGISLFIVPKFLVNDDGTPGPRNDVWCASLEHKLGIHASPTAVMLYGDSKGAVGAGAIGYRVGEENRGLEYMFIMMNAARYAVGLQGIAISDRALQCAQAYAAQRIQGRAVDGSSGPVSIDHHPDVQRLLMTMRALTEANRAMALYAAGLADKAHSHPDTAERARCQALYDYFVPIVKGFATESAVEVTSLGIQVHGGMGYIEETGAAQFFRDARILPIYEGTTAIQANDFVGRKILRDGGTLAREVGTQITGTIQALRHTASGAAADDAETLSFIAGRLELAVAAYLRGLEQTLAAARTDMYQAYLGSVPLLMLTGIVQGGWHMARAVLACHEAMQAGQATEFHHQKRATAVFHAAHLLPRAAAYADAIAAGHLVARLPRPRSL